VRRERINVLRERTSSRSEPSLKILYHLHRLNTLPPELIGLYNDALLPAVDNEHLSLDAGSRCFACRDRTTRESFITQMIHQDDLLP